VSTIVRFQGEKTTLSVDKLIKADHDKVRQLFTEYRSAKDNDVKKNLVYLIVRELSMHASKEEEVVYPAVRKAFGDGPANHLLEEHQQLKNLLSDLSGMTPDSNPEKWNMRVAEVEKVFQQHIKEEEGSEIPKLLKASGVDAFDLGQKFKDAEAHAVTRPHPWAPNKAPLNTLANAATAPLDAAADAIRFGGGAPNVDDIKNKK